jgi:RND family efflux transporter MFP subunit
MADAGKERWIMKAKIRLLVLGTAVATLVGSGCSRKAEPPPKPAPAVVARELVRRTVRSELMLTGTIEPDRSARLAAQVDGEVVALEVREGTAVREKQVLVRIDPSRIAAALDEARADHLAAKAQLEDARRVLERDRSLFERQGLSRERLERSETDVMRLEAAEAKARARIAGLEAQLADTEVKAPFDGYILERSVELGDVVKNGTPLLAVASRTLHALVPVSEIALVGLAEGAKVRLRSDAAVGGGCNARITRIRPRIDPTTRTADVEVVPGPEACDVRWLPGMLVRATFMLAERTNVLAVPAEAVASRPDGSRTVFVVEGDVARQRKVKTGLEGGGWIEIMEGLSERDKVIVQGFEKLKDGAPIALPGKGPKPPKSERAAEAPKGQR